MREFSIMFGVLALWIVLNRWVLPWFGIHTCMSGGCAMQRRSECGCEPRHSSDRNIADTTTHTK
jgi:hypothetical protein